MTTVATRGAWVMPDAQQILPVDAPRDQWLAERRKGIGGSDASTVAGVNRYSSRYELWLDKTGRLPERETTARMEAGTRLEPVMRQWFIDRTGIAIRRQGLVASRERPWQRVSLDGLTEDGGLLESKTTSGWLSDEWGDDQTADHAEVQAQHGMSVTGRSHAWVVALIDGWDFRVRRVERDDALIATLTSMEHAFWHEHVLTDREPPIDTATALPAVKNRYAETDDTTAAASPADWTPLRDEYRSAQDAVKEAQTRKDIAEARIRALLGEAVALSVLGEQVATCKTITSHRLDGKALRAEHPDLAERFTRESSYRRLTLAKEPK